MKIKLLFLLKLLGISFVLFAFLGWIERGYHIILLMICSLLLPPDQSTVSLDYASSLRIIPFLALMLATPRVKVSRRMVFILIGLTIFFIIDIVSILAWGSFPNSQSTAAHLIFSQIWKTTGQWILPFLLWFIAIAKDIGDLFVTEENNFEK